MEDGIILTEGQEDVIFYKLIAEQLRLQVQGDFFGWGVGGADKMPIIAQVLCELGFRRVVGILDGNRADMRRRLEQEFPQNSFLVIPADDVRTKPATPPKLAVRGLLDERRIVREEYRQQIITLFDRINDSLGAR